jgi:hypothetical protein
MPEGISNGSHRVCNRGMATARPPASSMASSTGRGSSRVTSTPGKREFWGVSESTFTVTARCWGARRFRLLVNVACNARTGYHASRQHRQENTFSGRPQ